jgi:hypothetical protein
VTTIVKPIVDAAAPGRTPFTFTGQHVWDRGEVLVVIFNDPTDE